MSEKESKFEYGEVVTISASAPKSYHPSVIGFICGMMDIDSEEVATAYNCIGSDWLYTVELVSGESVQIPEKHLEKDQDSS